MTGPEDRPDGADEPPETERWVAAALAAPVPVDPGRREAQIAVAMASFEQGVVDLRSVRRRRRPARLLAAAAVVLALGVAGLVMGPWSDSTDVSTASREADSDDLSQPTSVEGADAAPEDATAAAREAVDLGTFTTDADLVARLGTMSATRDAGGDVGSAGATSLPATPGAEADRPPEQMAPAMSLSACVQVVAPEGITAYTATVAGTTVVAVADGAGAVRVYDAATCTVRDR